jgi:hypothetical protein
MPQVIIQTRRDDDFASFLVAVNRLRMRLRAVGMPHAMMEDVSDEMLKAWRTFDPDVKPRGGNPLRKDLSIVTEYVAEWLGTANPVSHGWLRLALHLRQSGAFDRAKELQRRAAKAAAREDD